MASETIPPTTDADLAWSSALQRVLAEPRRVRVHYQPIVDLQRGSIRGYEALARFPEAPALSPRAWFDAAERLGCAGALEAQLIQAALVAGPLLVRNRFVSVNVSPAALLSAEVQTALGAERRMQHIVVEITDGAEADPTAVRAAVDALRAAGAAIAVDDTGAGVDSLDRVVALRPHYIKVAGRVIAGIDSDRTRVAMVETLAQLATKLDSWLIAKAVETDEQLDVLVRLGVPFGQGFALGHPAPAMAELSPDVKARIRRRSLSAAQVAALAALVERVPAVGASPQAVAAAFASDRQLEYVVCVDSGSYPLGVLDRPAHERGTAPRPPLYLPASISLHEGARRAMARPLSTRFDAIVIVDEDGAYAGLVPIDRLVSALTR